MIILRAGPAQGGGAWIPPCHVIGRSLRPCEFMIRPIAAIDEPAASPLSSGLINQNEKRTSITHPH
jgi:hypothetical protein